MQAPPPPSLVKSVLVTACVAGRVCQFVIDVTLIWININTCCQQCVYVLCVHMHSQNTHAE